MEKIKNFTELIVWQEGHKLVLMIYEYSKNFPSEEKFSLTSQIRRSAVSITSNIAEGFGRQGKNDKIQFYIIARGSLLELQNQLLIAKDINLLKEIDYNKLLNQSIVVHKLTNGLIKSIRQEN